jgi:hypothetical protein
LGGCGIDPIRKRREGQRVTILGILKQFVVLPESFLPAGEQLPRVVLVVRQNFNITNAALVAATHGFSIPAICRWDF